MITVIKQTQTINPLHPLKEKPILMPKYIFIGYLMFFVFVANAQTNAPSTTAIQPTTNTPANPLPPAYSSNQLVNFIRTFSPKAPIISEAAIVNNQFTNYQIQQATAYFDGLGRPLQTVMKQVSPTGNDMVSMHLYDAFGRESQQYLPYVHQAGGAENSNGKFKTNPFQQQAAFMQAQFPGETIFYNQTEFESSPLNRPIKTMAAGNSWGGSNRGISMQYQFNEVNEVRIWDIADSYAALPVSNTTYQSGELFKNITIDEHQKQVIEYKDKEGRVILKKVQINNEVNTTTHDGWLCTYYVYDDYGLLRFVIPPKAVELLATHQWNIAHNDLTNVSDELCFRYEYDEKQRMIAKKVPGANWVWMVYDKRDRLVFTQDGNMRTKTPQWWMYTLYDDMNRPIQTGILYYNSSREGLQNYVNAVTGNNQQTPNTNDINLLSSIEANSVVAIHNAQTNHYKASSTIIFDIGFETNTGDEIIAEIVNETPPTVTTTIAVSDNPIPNGHTTLPLTYTFYDNYTQTNLQFTTANHAQLVAEGNIGTEVFPESLPQAANTLTKGMVTSSRVRVLEDAQNLSLGKWMETANFYDEKGRTIQVNAANYKGGRDIITHLYSFNGQVLATYRSQNNPLANIKQVTELTQYLYDHADRVTQIFKTFNNQANNKRRIVQQTYNELGQIQTKALGQKHANGQPTITPLESDDYAYNIRGWLKGVNWQYSTVASGPLTNVHTNKWFAFDLSYDWGFQQNQYNGNIAGQRWKSAGDLTERAFGYTYDNANRLLLADFNQNNGSSTAAVWNKHLTAGGTGNIDFTVKMGDGINYQQAYDANGNIIRMQQMGLQLHNSLLLDDLNYRYFPQTNKLASVTDFVNNANSVLGDFKTINNHSQFNDKNNITNGTQWQAANNIADYGYDINGNLITDRNKGIIQEQTDGTVGINQIDGGAIIYNHLNLPQQITVKGKGTITYIYDAAGNKLEKRTVDKTKNQQQPTTHITTYLQGYVYNDNQLQYIQQEEGRVRPTINIANNTLSFVYDYMLKDHLGNVRSLLTEEQTQVIYPAATVEEGNTNELAVEQAYYQIKPANIVASPLTLPQQYENNNGNPPANTNPHSATTAISNKMYLLNGQGSNNQGLGITLKVMAGDAVDIFAKSYWFNNGVAPTNNNSISENLLQLLSNFVGSSAVTNSAKIAVSGSMLSSAPATTAPLSALLQNNETGIVPLQPKAFVNWILFDEHFIPVTGGVSAVGAGNLIKNHRLTATINKNGYLYVYCSNESNANLFFDNLQLIHNKGPLLEETHYYPFGLTMAGISSKAAGGLENKRKFNDGTELENKEFSDGSGLELYATEFRSYDAQIGRFHQIDPLTFLTDDISPYAFSRNNPILFNDPFGLTDSIRSGTIPTPGSIQPGQVWILPGKNGTDWFYTYDPDNPNAIQDGDYAGYVPGGSSSSNASEVTVNASKKKKNTNTANTANTGQAIAGRLMLGGRITFNNFHPAPPNPRFRNDLANADDNIRDAAAGQQVHTSQYGHARGVLVTLDPRLLRMLEALSQTYELEVSELAGARHGSNSRHYVGIAVDITRINGRTVSANNPHYRQLMRDARTLGATEVLGPGQPDHGGHIHLGMPRR